MRWYDHFPRLLTIIGLALLGMLATFFVSALLLLLSGMSMSEILEMSEGGMGNLPPNLMRALLAAQHIFVFILPGLVFGFIFYRSRIWEGLDLKIFPGWVPAVLGVLFLLSAYPLVNLSYLLNESIPLPSWANALEDQAEETIKALLDTNSPIIFIFNLLLIAILPGIGEELLFRGIIQKHIGGLLKNPIAGIWISAFIFSAIHMQFEGFLPRMVLGATLGYLYHWTKNLWIPIIAHAFNNGIQVVLIYTLGIELSEFEEKGSDQLQWWMIVISVAVMYLIYQSMTKKHKPGE